ncbi:MAG: phosphoribosylanthranilate isomerase [Cyanobacteria bacterium P01_G01_bin.54]
MIRIKICCIRTLEEAQLAIRLGADALGLVSAMPSGPGVIAEEKIAQIAAAVPPPIATFLLTSQTDPEAIITQQRRCQANTLQLCDSLTAEAHQQLRHALPGIKLVQVVHVLNEQSIAEALAVAPQVDALLLDSGNPTLPVKQLGGTGRVHNWAVSAEIVRRSPRPVFLAGGLKPENVGAAIRQVQPFGIDICTGVRTDGRLDAQKLTQLISRVQEGIS